MRGSLLPAGIPPRSRKRNGTSSQYSRSVASSSPTKRPQSVRVSNGCTPRPTGSPAAPSSPEKSGEAGPATGSKHRRARSWVPNWNSKKEGASEDHRVVELVADEPDLPDVLPDADKAGKSKKTWGWGWARHKDVSTPATPIDDEEEARDQGYAVAEGSPVKAAIPQDTKARSRLKSGCFCTHHCKHAAGHKGL
jgi:hypothetical protein